MTPDDLDSRLRQAFTETSSALQPSVRPAADIMDALRRRRERRHRSLVTVGCVVVAALAVGAGSYSYASRTDNREASGVRAHSPITTTRTAAAAAPGVARRGTPSQQAQSTLACAASVTVGSGPSRCVGVFSASASNGSEFSASNSAGGTADVPSAPAAPVSVTATVGQHVTVSLPVAPVGSWGAPIATPASALPATVRQELGSNSAAHVGAMRVVVPAQSGGKLSASTVFEAVKPGDVVLTATLKGACTPSSDPQATTVPPPCAGIRTSWSLLVVIASR